MTVTLITGGSSGIGAVTARCLADLGHRVVVTGRDQSRLDALAKEIDVLPVAGDAADYDAVSAAVRTAVETYGSTVLARRGLRTGAQRRGHRRLDRVGAGPTTRGRRQHGGRPPVRAGGLTSGYDPRRRNPARGGRAERGLPGRPAAPPAAQPQGGV